MQIFGLLAARGAGKLNLEQLGLTPAAVGKVSTLGPEPKKDPVSQFKSQRPGRATVTRIGAPV